MKTIETKNWYTPMEIAKLGLIKNSRGDAGTVSGNYNYVLGLIKSDRLKAKNYSTGKKLAYYLVSEDEIKKYHQVVGG